MIRRQFEKKNQVTLKDHSLTKRFFSVDVLLIIPCECKIEEEIIAFCLHLRPKEQQFPCKVMFYEQIMII